MTTTHRLLLGALITTGIGGCAAHSLEFIEQSNTASTGLRVTNPVVIIADTQIHESRGTASRYWSRAGDELVDVTVRTAQQVIGAPDVLAEVLSAFRKKPVLHLGDALDVSCETEWETFASTMIRFHGTAGPNGWLFAPGNHDGFLVGNIYAQNGVYPESYWDQVCNVGRYDLENERRNLRFAKESLIERYVAQLEMEGNDELECFDVTPPKFCISKQVDHAAPWRSFVVQLTQLPPAEGAGVPVYALLLDTSNFEKAPSFAGVEGWVSSAQLRAAQLLVARLPAEARFFIAGHHDLAGWRLNDWGSEQRTRFQALLNDPRFLRFVVTAHTHGGGWISHKLWSGTVLELNVGSMIDPPIRIANYGLSNRPMAASWFGLRVSSSRQPRRRPAWARNSRGQNSCTRWPRSAVKAIACPMHRSSCAKSARG
jgi:hypothetical protein